MGGIELMGAVVWSSFVQTLYMVFWSTLLSVIIGFIPAIILTLTAPDGLRPNKPVYETLSFLVNVFRSFPFIILLVLIIPFTRFVAGRSIGTTAAIVPLTVSAIPYIARVFETSLRETDPGVIEAARSFGASDWQILFRVYIKESIPRMLVLLPKVRLYGFLSSDPVQVAFPLPFILLSMPSNLVRNGAFSMLWISRWNPLSLSYEARPPRRVPRWEW